MLHPSMTQDTRYTAAVDLTKGPGGFLQRFDHRSVQALEQDLRNSGGGVERGPKPVIWTTTAEEILSSIARYLQRINGAGH